MISVSDLLVLSQIPGIGGQRLRNLVSHFGNPTDVLQASAREISGIEGFSKRLASVVAHFIRGEALEPAQRYAAQQLSRINNINGRLLTFWDKQYPDLLKKIYDPPPYLFVRGTIQESDKYALAVVGTRTPSEYGRLMAERFSHDIVSLGIMVVSGLARGVDTIAHKSALQHGGRTYAVIGSGLDVFYPPENRNLCDRIAGYGAVVSEFEMGAKPDAVNFPRRNRLISGLSLGTIVIETDLDGGAMITASTALDQNREVFALPANLGTKRSSGSNTLIKQGKAKLVECMDDILEELSMKLRPMLKSVAGGNHDALPALNLFERAVFEALTDGPIHIDAICERAHAGSSDVLVHLLSLEFKNYVKQLPGKMFLKL